MSLPQQKLSDTKAKSKFQSLPINTIYQGAANRNSSKTPLQKHGLQSLGKVPTARRAPANLPSVKSEKGGNDPNVVLVPTGGAGWTSNSKESENKPAEKQETQSSGAKQELQEPVTKSNSGAAGSGATTNNSAPKTWSSVTGARQTRAPNLGHEFPSLRTGGQDGQGKSEETDQLGSQVGRLQLQSGAGKDDPGHGNGGPMLRPQTFGNWTQGGGKAVGQQSGQTEPGPEVMFPVPQPHKPTPPSSSTSSMPPASKPSSNQFKAIMPHFMDVIEPPVNLTDSHRRISRERPSHGSRRGEPPPRGRPEFTPPSIIDKEKLRRMDDIGGDDWTYDDDSFDYNKRLQSDEEDTNDQESLERPDPNWADQVEKHGSQSPAQYQGYYDEKKAPGTYEDLQDDRRRNKKSEEVMKNIERARKRREEEENRFRRPPSMEQQRPDLENGHNRRYDDNNKELSKVNDRRGDWSNDDKSKGRPHHSKGRYDDRRRFEDRGFDTRPGGGAGYTQPRFDSRKEEKNEYKNFEDSHSVEEDYKQFGRKERVFEDVRDRNRSSEERSFSEFSHHEESSGEGGWNQRSGGYSKQTSSRHISGEMEMENGTSEWGAPRTTKNDWTEDLEINTSVEQQPSRPNSRDSRISKDSRSSKDGKNARNSMERAVKKLEQFPETKSWKQEQFANNFEDKKVVEKKAQNDIRGYFEPQEEQKKGPRVAPGPVPREKIEAASQQESSGMTTLKKRESAKPEPVKPEPEVVEKLNPLVDSDLLENISDDDDGLLNSPEKEDRNLSNKSRGGRGRGGQDRKVVPQRGGRGMERGGRGGRGRGDVKQKGRSDGYQPIPSFEETEESKKNKKNLEKSNEVSGQPPHIGGFMPRGQPSRRGRGDGRVRGSTGRGSGRHYADATENLDQEVNDWAENERGAKIPPRMQRKRDERKSKGEGDEIEDWDNESENSGEDKRKRDSERGRGRGGRGWDSRGGGRGGGRGGMSAPPHNLPTNNDNREPTPESDAAKKRSGIENIDLHDFAGVVVVDQDAGGGTNADHDLETVEAGEFMQVVNKKTRPPPIVRDDKKGFDRTASKMGDNRNDKYGSDKYGGDKYNRGDKYANMDQYGRNDFNKQKNMYAFKNSKQLPPRLAKVREESRAQAARTGGVSPSAIEQNGWPEGDKMGVFQVDDLGTNAWEKTAIRRDKEGSEGADLRTSPKVGKENGGIQQTLVFENTSLKSSKDKNSMDKAGIQLPVGLGKPEDNLDVVKLDFFSGEDMSSQGKPPISIPRSMTHLSAGQGIPPSPSTDDLSVKLANTKKLWDSPGMAGVPENSVATSWNDGTTFTENSGFERFQDPGNQNSDNVSNYDKQENMVNAHQANCQKGKPVSMSMDQDTRPNNPMQFNRLAGNTMPAIPSPPTQLNQMGTMPQSWGYQLDRTYNPYNQSILMAGTHSIGTDLFTGSNGAGGYRLQNTGAYPGTQQSTANMISQANLISGGVKHSSQIGPIGTKAGTGASTSPYLQPGLGTLSNTFIQYDASNFNFVNPTAAGLQRGSAPPAQTAFYQRQPQLALNAAIPGSYNHLSAQQQLRANHQVNHVASLPFIKNDLSAALSNQQKNQLASNDFNAAPNFGGGGGANNRTGAAPTSPKTKLKMEQQQQQQQQAGVTAAGLNQLVQLRMGLGFNMGMAGVQPGYPSPIARPQLGQGTGNQGLHGKSDYYTQEVGEEKGEQDKAADGKEVDAPAGDKVDADVDSVVDPVQ